MDVQTQRDLLAVRFPAPQRFLSWAIHNGGARQGHAVAWVGVRNEELPIDLDPQALLRERLAHAGLGDAVGLLTSRDLLHYVHHRLEQDALAAVCVVTVGLSNALRVGDPPGAGVIAGTINLLCWCSVPLDDAGMLEALSIAVEARTTAIYEAQVKSRRSGARATGTGTDCVVMASPAAGGERQPYAGKHTDVGHVIGTVVHGAVLQGARDWLAAHGSTLQTI